MSLLSSRILFCVLAWSALAGCRQPPQDAGDVSPSSSHPSGSPVSISPSTPLDGLTRAEIARTGFAITADTEVLGVHRESGIDSQLRFAVRMPTGRVEAFLENAGFTEPLVAGRRVFQTPVDGIDTRGADHVASAQDRYRADGGSLVRDVMRIDADDGTAIVHVWAYSL